MQRPNTILVDSEQLESGEGMSDEFKAIAAHQIEEGKDLVCRCASRVTADWPGHRHARVAVDGETLECRLPLDVEVQPRALTVLVPREPEPRE